MLLLVVPPFPVGGPERAWKLRPVNFSAMHIFSHTHQYFFCAQQIFETLMILYIHIDMLCVLPPLIIGGYHIQTTNKSWTTSFPALTLSKCNIATENRPPQKVFQPPFFSGYVKLRGVYQQQQILPIMCVHVIDRDCFPEKTPVSSKTTSWSDPVTSIQWFHQLPCMKRTLFNRKKGTTTCHRPHHFQRLVLVDTGLKLQSKECRVYLALGHQPCNVGCFFVPS